MREIWSGNTYRIKLVAHLFEQGSKVLVSFGLIMSVHGFERFLTSHVNIAQCHYVGSTSIIKIFNYTCSSISNATTGQIDLIIGKNYGFLNDLT